MSWLRRLVWCGPWRGYLEFVLEPPPSHRPPTQPPRVIFINASPVRRVKGLSSVQRAASKRRAYVQSLRS